MRCNRCDREVAEDSYYVHEGETLCEDCYLETGSQVRICDPFAVHAAKRIREIQGLKGTEGLSELQKTTYEFIKSHGKVTREEITENLKLGQSEMETQIAILRHCDLIKGSIEDGKVYLMPS